VAGRCPPAAVRAARADPAAPVGPVERAVPQVPASEPAPLSVLALRELSAVAAGRAPARPTIAPPTFRPPSAPGPKPAGSMQSDDPLRLSLFLPVRDQWLSNRAFKRLSPCEIRRERDTRGAPWRKFFAALNPQCN